MPDSQEDRHHPGQFIRQKCAMQLYSYVSEIKPGSMYELVKATSAPSRCVASSSLGSRVQINNFYWSWSDSSSVLEQPCTILTHFRVVHPPTSIGLAVLQDFSKRFSMSVPQQYLQISEKQHPSPVAICLVECSPYHHTLVILTTLSTFFLLHLCTTEHVETAIARFAFSPQTWTACTRTTATDERTIPSSVRTSVTFYKDEGHSMSRLRTCKHLKLPY